jgi:hypothetical protein
MLGRFRMTVIDCMQEYERLGSQIFANPRPLRMLLTKQTKYDTEAAEQVFKDVVNRRQEMTDGPQGHINRPRYPSAKEMCNT